MKSRLAASHRVARELPTVVGFQQYAQFQSIDCAENRQRFYLVSWQPLLWGGGALVWSWGRLGSRGSSRVAEFADRNSAQPAVERLIHRRLQRRYELIDWA